MDRADKLAMAEALSGERDSFVLEQYLDLAAAKISLRANPYDEAAAMPPQYEVLQCELAAFLVAKRGAEGQSAHSENGVSRTYLGEDEYLRQVVPKAGLPL